eukprot:TRINITY_DN2810_c0_g2_i1.p1 TRINITY_DN2810_c0_g2~~TRINITY_DN2810_c0_g2_i1.p1  ORF type:complete len:253 (-),score=80.04 TRINITY_DN2810_c0_g2_i1:182-895(-)
MAANTLAVRFSLRSDHGLGHLFIPREIFLVFQDQAGNQHLYLPTVEDDAAVSFRLDFAEERNLSASGQPLKMTLSVGDILMANPIRWVLGEVEVDGEGEEAETLEALEAAPPAPHESSPLLPEIRHIFRPKENRPPLVVSMTFALLAVIPLLAFVYGLLRLGINLAAFPPQGSKHFASAASFHAGIACILILFVFCWIKMNLFLTLRLLPVLALAVSVPGYLTLTFLADTIKKSKAE